MAEILELSDKEFKTTLISMLRAQMEKINNMQEQMGNIIREVKTLRKNQEKTQEKNKNIGSIIVSRFIHAIPKDNRSLFFTASQYSMV